MAKGVAYAVFILPVLFTIVFSSIVMVGALDDLDRELHMFPATSGKSSSHNNLIEILGLQKQYSIDQPIQIDVQIKDTTFDCGDLYITIYSSSAKTIISQNAFFEQCFAATNSLIPSDDYSEVVNIPGNYLLEVEMKDKSQTESISISQKFTVK